MKETTEQRWQEELLADRGYRFVEQDGNDFIWKFVGFSSSGTHTVRVTPEGKVIKEEVQNEGV